MPPIRRNRCFLEYVQQTGLKIHRHQADLVEEKGPSVGYFQQTLLLESGIGEGAELVTEQLRRHEARRYVHAIHGDEPPLARRAEHVDRPCYHLFAGTAFTADQHGCLSAGDPAHHGEHFLHGLTVTYGTLQPPVGAVPVAAVGARCRSVPGAPAMESVW